PPNGLAHHEVWVADHPMGSSRAGGTLVQEILGDRHDNEIVEVVPPPGTVGRYLQVWSPSSVSWIDWREVEVFEAAPDSDGDGVGDRCDTTDVLIPGKTALLKPGAKIYAQSKGTFMLPSSVSSGTLAVFDTAVPGAGSNTYPLTAGTWRALGTPPGSKGFKYKGGGTASDPCKSVKVTPK